MAMSYGKAVLVSDLQGMTEIVSDGHTGYVFRQGVVSDLEQKVCSALGLGCFALGGPFKGGGENYLAYGTVNDEESIATIQKAFEMGINIYDTADVYGLGHSERILGKALHDQREEIIIASKFGNLFDEKERLGERTVIGKEFRPEYIKKAVEETEVAGIEVVVIGLFSRLRAGKGSVGLDLRQVQLIKDLAEGHQRVVVVSFGSPYFLRHFKDVDVYLCAYRYADPSQISAVKALFGEIDITGKLPVSIPGAFPLGHGLKILKKNRE